ncbi:MAG: hypothetical protein IIA60_09025 [Candidatus Marinimicrobia bacterium]|nr:hypothetical protein [Candidatus Neomarinimicrobiota bacterium]
MTLLELGIISQILLTIITFTGISISLYLSVKALREVQADRRQRQNPHLAFEIGGARFPVEFIKAGYTIPGIRPDFAKKFFNDLPDDAESVRIKNRVLGDGNIEFIYYGHLNNYGLGPALETKITWVAEKVKIGAETFVIDEMKLQEPRYNLRLNTMPPKHQHIQPGDATEFGGLPVFIQKDTEKKVTEVNGVLVIRCKDVSRREHTALQDFYLKTGYKDSQPWVHVTFLGIRSASEED